MFSGFYLFFIVASCFIVMHAYASIIIDDQYIPINDDRLQRVTRFIFPSIGFSSPSRQSNEYLDFIPSQRQSFGRKHHWDVYFGRRR